MTMFSTNSISHFVIAILAAAFLLVFFADYAAAQRRDFMTDAEIELIRDNQEIDLRINVLTKMIDRRFAALNIVAGGSPAKESEKWGPNPTGTRIDLLFDIKLILQKAIDDIDDVAAHGENALELNRKSGKLFPKAVRELSAAASRFKPVFETQLTKTKDEKEKGVLLDSIEFCTQITEAASTLPPEPPKEEKKKSRKNDGN